MFRINSTYFLYITDTPLKSKPGYFCWFLVKLILFSCRCKASAEKHFCQTQVCLLTAPNKQNQVLQRKFSIFWHEILPVSTHLLTRAQRGILMDLVGRSPHSRPLQKHIAPFIICLSLHEMPNYTNKILSCVLLQTETMVTGSSGGSSSLEMQDNSLLLWAFGLVGFQPSDSTSRGKDVREKMKIRQAVTWTNTFGKPAYTQHDSPLPINGLHEMNFKTLLE